VSKRIFFFTSVVFCVQADSDGKTVDLGAVYGTVPAVLVVNVASKCGLTSSNYTWLGSTRAPLPKSLRLSVQGLGFRNSNPRTPAQEPG